MNKSSKKNARNTRDKKLKNSMKIPKNYFFEKILLCTNIVYSVLDRLQDTFLKYIDTNWCMRTKVFK